jgi:hypothetical protein
LSHAEYSQNEAVKRIRFSEIFNNKANCTITDQIHGKKKSVKRTFLPDDPEDNKKNDAFKKSLIQLGRMAKLMSVIKRKVHTPGDTGYPTVQLTIDEVANPSESIPKRDGRAKEISQTPEWYPVLPAKNES